MLKNFEKYTHELTYFEKNTLLPYIEKILRRRIGKDNAITNNEIVEKIKKAGYELPSANARVRKIIHVIRATGIVERLIGSAKGYYVSNDQKEVLNYLGTLAGRIESISDIMEAMESQIPKKEKEYAAK